MGAKRTEVAPFHRAYEGILSFISRHGLVAGDRLPSERELCQELDVSRTTLRSALASLSSSCVIECRQGAGNFVCADRPTTYLNDLSGFSEIAAKAGRKATSRIVKMGVEAADPEVAERLYLSADERVFVLSRLRFVDGVAVSLETAHLCASLFPGIERLDFGDLSLSEVLRVHYGVSPCHTTLKVFVDRASSGEASQLEVEPLSLVFREVGTRLDADMNPIEFYTSVSVPSRYRIVCDNYINQPDGASRGDLTR